MQYSSDVKTAAKLVLISLVAGLGLLSSSLVSAQQAGTDVSVRVCPVTPNSSLVVTAPQSDSKTDNSKIVIEGDVQYISQIDFFVDDSYNHTIALGYSATGFRTDLTVSPGTHTIRLQAIDSCHPEPLIENVIITYEPKSQSTIGSDILTQIPALGINRAPGSIFSPSVNLSPGEQESDGGPGTPESGDDSTPGGLYKDRSISDNSHNNLDIGNILGDGRLDLWLRAALIVIGAVMLLAPWIILSITDHVRQGLVDHLGRQVKRHAPHSHLQLIVRFVGILLLLIAFLI